MARIRFINSDGGGFSDMITVRDGITLSELLAERGITNPSNFTIRVNGQEGNLENDVVADGSRVSAISRPGTPNATTPISENDRVSLTPKKIAGANG